MLIKEIKEFQQIKEKARTYLCYIMSSNIAHTCYSESLDKLLSNLEMLKQAIPKSEVIYAIDSNGIQITS